MNETLRNLCDRLSWFVGETGESESAVETLDRLINELNAYRQEKKNAEIIDFDA